MKADVVEVVMVTGTANGATLPAGPTNVFDVLRALDATSQDSLLRTFSRATLRDVRLSCSAGRAFVDRQVTALCLDYASICRAAAAAAGPKPRCQAAQRPQQPGRDPAALGQERGYSRGGARGRGQRSKRGSSARTQRWDADADGDEEEDHCNETGLNSTRAAPHPHSARRAEGAVTQGSQGSSRQPPALQDQLAAALPRWDRLTALTLVLRPGHSPGLAGKAPDVTAALLQPLGCEVGPMVAGMSSSIGHVQAASGAAAPAPAAAGPAAAGGGQVVPAAAAQQRVIGGVERLAVWFEGTLRSTGGPAGTGHGRGRGRGRGSGRGSGRGGDQPTPLALPPPSLGPTLALAFPGLRCLDLSIRRWSEPAWVWTGTARAASACGGSSGSSTTCPLMLGLSNLRRLEELRLPSAACLADVGCLTGLTSLHVTARRGALRPGSAAALGGLPRLRRLVLAGEARRGPEHVEEVEQAVEAARDGTAEEREEDGVVTEAAAQSSAPGAVPGTAAAGVGAAGAAWLPVSGSSSAAGSRGGSGGGGGAGGGGGGPEERLLRADVASLLPPELLRLLRSPPPALQQLHFTELAGMPPNSGLLIGPPCRGGIAGGGGTDAGGLTPGGTPGFDRDSSSAGGSKGTATGAAAWEMAAQAQADAARGPNAAARLTSTSVGLALGFGARASILAAGPGSGSVGLPPWVNTATASAAAAAAEQEAAAQLRVVTVAYAEGRTWMGPLGSLAAAAVALAEGLREQSAQRAEAAGAGAGSLAQPAAPDAMTAATAAAVENFVVRDLWVMPGRRGMPLSDDVRAAHRLLAELRQRYGCRMALRHLTASFGIQLDDTTYLLEEVGALLGAPAAVSLTDLDLYDLEAAPPALAYQLQQQVEARQAAAAAAAVAQLGLEVAAPAGAAAASGGAAAGARGPGAAAAAAAAAAPRRRRHSDGALGPVSHAAASRAAALVHYLRTVFGAGAATLQHHSPPAALRLGAPGAGGGSPASTASGGYDAATAPPTPALPADQQLTLLALNGCMGLGVDVAAQLAAVLPSLRRLSVGFSLPPQDGAVLGHLCELLASTTVGRRGGGAAAADGEAALVVGVCPRPSGRRGRRGGASQAERLELLAEMNRRLEDMAAGGRVRLAWALEDEAAEQSSVGQVEAAEGRAQRQRSGEGWGGYGDEDSGSGSDFDGFGASADEDEDEEDGGEQGEAGPPVSRWWAW